MNIFKLFFLFIFLLSCSVGRKYQEPVVASSETWKNKIITGYAKKASSLWWKVFDDPNLNVLIDQAIRNNFDLKIAFARVSEAKAIKEAIQSQLYPQLNLEPGYNSLLHFKENGNGSLQRFHIRSYLLPLVMQWEIDLFNRIESQVKAASFNVQKMEEIKRDVLLIITTDVAKAYYNIRIYEKQLVILYEALNRFKSDYKIVEDRYKSKISNYSDVTRAGLLISSTEASIEETKRKKEIVINLLATLLGLPASCFTFEAPGIDGTIPAIPSGLPSDILRQRPDIRAYEKERLSRHFDINAAEAAFFPSLKITAGGGFSSPIFKDFMAWISRWILYGINSTQMVYDGGYMCAELNLALSKFKAADYEYKQMVLKAFQEVENSLSNIERYSKEYEKAYQSYLWAKNTYEIADIRYLNGFTFYLDVTEAQTKSLQYQLLVAELLGLEFISTVDLIKALGGSF
jgi:multidrug efflux system outer membrane protein